MWISARGAKRLILHQMGGFWSLGMPNRRIWRFESGVVVVCEAKKCSKVLWFNKFAVILPTVGKIPADFVISFINIF